MDINGMKKNSGIIDRTLMEIMHLPGIEEEVIEEYCNMAGKIGISLMEVDRKIMEKVRACPLNIGLIYRIETEQDVEFCLDNQIMNCIITAERIKRISSLTRLYELGRMIMAEFEADNYRELEKIGEMIKNEEMYLVKTIRINGLTDFGILNWIDQIKRITRYFKIKMDICPRNQYYSATAIAVEACINSMEYVTVTLGGYGNKYGFAALEEVMVAFKVLIDPDCQFNLSLLKELAAFYQVFTSQEIEVQKPVFGADIFKYESGIHADGIEKDPSTYEPFDPGLIGKNRSLIIGKHSGSRSLSKKLKELSIECSSDEVSRILKLVQKKSTEKGRQLHDEEIKNICSKVVGL